MSSINNAVNLESANFNVNGTWQFNNEFQVICSSPIQLSATNYPVTIVATNDQIQLQTSSGVNVTGLPTAIESYIVYYNTITNNLSVGASPVFTSVSSTLITTKTTSGTFTPNSNTLFAVIEIYGGGGGGGGATGGVTGSPSTAGGGGSGAYALGIFTKADMTPNFSYTIGAGGTAGLAGATGGSGGNSTTSIGLVAYGGQGGTGTGISTGSQLASGGNGGVSSGTGAGNGGYDITGSPGTAGMSVGNGAASFSIGGTGGSIGPFSGAASNPQVTGTYQLGFSPNSGLSGGASGGATGGASFSAEGGIGGTGFMIVTEYLYS